MSAEPFISNDLFILYSDIVLIERYDLLKLNTIFEKCIQINRIRKHNHIIIFVKTEYLDYYLPYFMNITFLFILITNNNDDQCVPYYHFPCSSPEIKENHDALLNNKYLFKWFTKNPSIIHSKLIPIPLGPKWQYRSSQFFGEDKAPIIKILEKYCLDPLYHFQSPKKKLLYFHFGQTTNETFYSAHKNIRNICLEICKKEFELSTGTDFENYLIELQKHKFALSPPGRGLDTHRTWECLMVGTIPIVIHSPLDILYEKLPVLIIDDWSVLTPSYLEEQYILFQSRTYDFTQLYASYWKTKIQENSFTKS